MKNVLKLLCGLLALAPKPDAVPADAYPRPDSRGGMEGDMLLKPEQVREIREYHRHEGQACPGSGCAKCDVARLIRDRAEIAAENAELKKFAAGLELNLAALIQHAEAAEKCRDKALSDLNAKCDQYAAASQCVTQLETQSEKWRERAEAAEGYLAELSPRYADIVAERAELRAAIAAARVLA